MIFVVIKCYRHDKFVLFSEKRLTVIDVEWSRKSDDDGHNASFKV